MFDKEKIATWIAVFWIVAFVGFWVILNSMFPKDEFVSHISKLEQHIADNDWTQAAEEMNRVEEVWRNNRFLVELTNAEEEISTFEHMLGQLKSSVTHQSQDAIFIVGGVKAGAKIIMKARAGS